MAQLLISSNATSSFHIVSVAKQLVTAAAHARMQVGAKVQALVDRIVFRFYNSFLSGVLTEIITTI